MNHPVEPPRHAKVDVLAAAYLLAWGCPAAPGGALPSDFDGWGLAVQSAVGIDRDGRLHVDGCPDGGDVRRARRAVLAGLERRSCSRCLTADVVVESGNWLFNLGDLLHGFTDAAAGYVADPLLFGSVNCHVMHFGQAVLDAIDLHRTVGSPSGELLDKPLERFTAWMRACVERASAGVRADGLEPLEQFLTQRWREPADDPALGVNIRRAARTANDLIRDATGGAGGSVVCSFRIRSRITHAILQATAASVDAAVTPPVTWNQRRAIAVLPAPLAVWLFVDWLFDQPLYAVEDHPMAFLDREPDDPQQFAVTAQTALCLWEEHDHHPNDAWRVARAVGA